MPKPTQKPTVVSQQIDTLAEWAGIFPVLDRIIIHQLTYSYATTPEEDAQLRLFLEEIRKPR